MTKQLVDLLGHSLDDLRASGIATPVASGLRWGEGPAFIPEIGAWIFSDIPNNRILSYSQDRGTCVFRQPSNFANGHYPLRNGGFASCEHLTRSVTVTDPAGVVSLVCDEFAERKLNSPNDVVEAADGALWFTDPTYGIISDLEGKRAECEQLRKRVYRFDRRTGELSAEIDALAMPNGLCFSSRGTRLYVADSGAEMGPELGFDPHGPRDVFECAIDLNGRVAGSIRHFCHIEHGVPDGMRCDAEDNLWVATGRGVECYGPDGGFRGVISSREVTSNLAFGGVAGDEVMITRETDAWLIRLRDH
ncbi:gluconolactonase [Rhizobium mesoamericanum]|uniref:SMP-30/gluconolactonase/LRE family protein n=1 Tax=Rhizobium mesoamericanum TaxID=1079800 RepID=UPI002786F966|nr:SMP-30/gluconolactonase/LRE family protein [Rhizobium mesoamericanum]MDQ0563190.1 gluconolactonase [Rhizobium mesoamericanum]